MLTAIVQNLMGYDAIIIFLALVNALVIVPKARFTSKRLKRQLQETVYLPIQHLLDRFRDRKQDKLDLHELQMLRDREVFYYHLFDTVNSLFPTLGILGTIIGLLRMAGMESDLIMQNFMVALTSTFWGLVASIVFRMVDGSMAPMFYQNQENLQMIFERLDSYYGKEQQDATEIAEKNQ